MDFGGKQQKNQHNVHMTAFILGGCAVELLLRVPDGFHMPFTELTLRIEGLAQRDSPVELREIARLKEYYNRRVATPETPASSLSKSVLKFRVVC